MSDLIFMDFLLQVIDSRKLKYSGGRISITTDSAGDILFRSAVDMQARLIQRISTALSRPAISLYQVKREESETGT
jgi:hypothetical protein